MKFPLLRTKAPIKEMNDMTIGLRLSEITREPIGIAILYDWYLVAQHSFGVDKIATYERTKSNA